MTFRSSYRYHAKDDYAVLRGLIHEKWQFEGDVLDHMQKITFIQNNQNSNESMENSIRLNNCVDLLISLEKHEK